MRALLLPFICSLFSMANSRIYPLSPTKFRCFKDFLLKDRASDRMKLNLIVFSPSGILDSTTPQLLDKASDFFQYRAKSDGWHRICFQAVISSRNAPPIIELGVVMDSEEDRFLQNESSVNLAKQSEVAEIESVVGKMISKVQQMRIQLNIEKLEEAMYLKSQQGMNKWIGVLMIIQIVVVIGVTIGSVWAIRRLFVKQRVN